MADPLKNDADPAQTWCRVASELQAYRASQQQAWGDIDNATLGRYLAGELHGEERRQVEEALEAFPELNRLTLLVQDVLGETEPITTPDVAPATAPVILPLAEFRAHPPARREARPRSRVRRWAPRLALLAAACVMLALGLNLAEPGRRLLRTRDASIHAENAVALAPSGGAGFTPPPGGPRFAGRAKHAPGRALRLDQQPDRAGGPRAAEADNLAAVYTSALNTVAATEDQVVTTWESLADHPTPRENPAPLAPASFAGANPYYMLTPGENPYRIVVKAKAEQTPSTRNAWRIYAGIASQKTDDVQGSVLPVLVQALRDAPNAKEKAKLARAIGRLGPAARIAVPTLTTCLRKAQSDEERRAFLFALNQVGLGADASGARRAVPEVLESLNCECPQARQLAAQVLVQVAPEARQQIALALRDKNDFGELRHLLREARSHPAWVGVRDPYQCFNVHTLCEAQKQINRLVQDNDVKVLVETVPASSLDEPAASEPLKGKRLRIRIAQDGSDVRVAACPSLEKRGLRPEHLRQLVQENTRKNAFDAGLLEGLQYLTGAVTE